MTDHDTRFPPPPAPPAGAEESIGELFRRLGADASSLVRHEVALARAELRQSARSLLGNAARLAIGGVTAAVGALVLLEALVLGLGSLLGGRYWLSALIVGVVLAAAGAFLLFAALRAAQSHSLAPERTLATLRETGEWARAEVTALKASLAGASDGSHGGRGADGGAALLIPRSRSAARSGEMVDAVDSAAVDADDVDADDVDADDVDADDVDADAVDADVGERTPMRRNAGSPTKSGDAPPLSWPLWKRVWTKYKSDDVANQAAKVAYYFFMSLPPLLMATFGLAGIFGGDDTAAWLTGNLQRDLPAEAGVLVNGFVTEVVHKQHPGLLSLGLVLAIWAGANVFMALEDTLNAAYGVKCARGFVQRRLVALAALLAVGLLFLAGSAALLAGPAIAKALGLGIAWSIVQWPVGLALVVAAFWVVYYVLPNRDQRGCKRVLLKSSAIAAALWLLATLGFRLYAANFGSYGKTYGVLGGMIVLLLWMDYTSLVILLGGEISSEMERSG